MDNYVQETHSTKISWKYPKCPKIYLPNLSAQAQKFGISMKKASLGVHSPWLHMKDGRPWVTIVFAGWNSSERMGKKEKKNTFLIKSCSLFQEHFTDMTSLLTGRRTVRSEYSAITKQDSEPTEPSRQIVPF